MGGEKVSGRYSRHGWMSLAPLNNFSGPWILVPRTVIQFLNRTICNNTNRRWDWVTLMKHLPWKKPWCLQWRNCFSVFWENMDMVVTLRSGLMPNFLNHFYYWTKVFPIFVKMVRRALVMTLCQDSTWDSKNRLLNPEHKNKWKLTAEESVGAGVRRGGCSSEKVTKNKDLFYVHINIKGKSSLLTWQASC